MKRTSQSLEPTWPSPERLERKIMKYEEKAKLALANDGLALSR
jgi:hypothetical protein